MLIRTNWRWMTAAAFAAAMLMGNTARAQEERRPDAERGQREAERGQREAERGQRTGQRSDAERRGAGAARRISDRDLAVWLIVDNVGEVRMSQAALEKAGSPQVRQFAQQMVEEHSQFIQQLQQVAGARRAGEAGTRERRLDGAGESTQPARPRTRDNEAADNEAGAAAEAAGTAVAQVREEREGAAQPERRPARTERDAAEDRTGRAADRGRSEAGEAGELSIPQAGGLVAFHAEVGEQTVKMQQELLSRKRGGEFDKAFMHGQIGAHVKALATLQTAQKHATSPQLKELLQKGEQTTKQHMEHAFKVIAQLERGQAGEGQGQERRGEADRSPATERPNRLEGRTDPAPANDKP
ncbi:MAG: DUF4142 domain-containing protein [Planctomycetes bacterium]|nr:DUF4142 domain-containing protein [Planctomycetota bacterium]